METPEAITTLRNFANFFKVVQPLEDALQVVAQAESRARTAENRLRTAEATLLEIQDKIRLEQEGIGKASEVFHSEKATAELELKRNKEQWLDQRKKEEEKIAQKLGEAEIVLSQAKEVAASVEAAKAQLDSDLKFLEAEKAKWDRLIRRLQAAGFKLPED